MSHLGHHECLLWSTPGYNAHCTYNVHITSISQRWGWVTSGIRLLRFLPRSGLSLNLFRGWKRRRHWDTCYSKQVIFLCLETGKMLRSCGRTRCFCVAIYNKRLHSSGFCIHVPNSFSFHFRFLYLCSKFIFISFLFLWFLFLFYFVSTSNMLFYWSKHTYKWFLPQHINEAKSILTLGDLLNIYLLNTSMYKVSCGVLTGDSEIRYDHSP